MSAIGPSRPGYIQGTADKVKAPIGPSRPGFVQGTADKLPDTSGNTTGGANQTQLQIPSHANDVGKYLDSYQKTVSDKLPNNVSDLGFQGAENAINQAAGSVRPTPPNTAAEFAQLSGQYGITTLNQQLTDAINKRNKIQESVRTAAAKTENQPGVTADVVAGRESEQQRLAQIQVDSANQEIETISTQLNTANNIVSTIMQFNQTDYQNASKAYNDQFDQNMKYQELLNSEAIQENKVASSNLQIIVSSSQGKGYDSLTPETQAMVQQLASTLGLPIGAVQNMFNMPDKLITMSNGEALFQKPDGTHYFQPIPYQGVLDQQAVKSIANLQSPSAISKVETSPGIFGMFKSYAYQYYDPITQKQESKPTLEEAQKAVNDILSKLQGLNTQQSNVMFTEQDNQDVQSAILKP